MDGGTQGRKVELPTVSVVIPTHGHAYRLDQAVYPVLEDPATTEVIVAVDRDVDGSSAVVARLGAEDERVKLVTTDEGGVRSALAAGVEQAKGDVVLLLDDDVVARPNLVTGHARRHAGEEHLVVVGYMPCAEAPRRRGVPAISRLYAREYEGTCEAIEAGRVPVLRALWGGNVSLQRDDCEEVGLTPWPYWHEDTEFGIRCERAGMTGIFDRALLAEHRHDRDATRFLAQARAYGEARVMLHHVHGDLLGPDDPDEDLRHVPKTLRPLVRTMGTPGRSRFVTTPLVALAKVAGACHATVIESRAYRLARRLEIRAGAVKAHHAVAARRPR